MFVKASFKSALLGTVCLVSGMSGFAQDTTDTDEESRELDKVVVVGSQIVGSDVAGALPVTVLNVDDIDVTGAGSGDELLRAIPQVGDIIFSEAEFTGGEAIAEHGHGGGCEDGLPDPDKHARNRETHEALRRPGYGGKNAP